MDVPAFPLPPEVVKPAEGEEHERGSSQEGNQTQRAPQEGVAGRLIPHERLIREVVGVGIRVAGTRRHRGPGGPGEEGRQPPEVLRISDIPRGQPPGRDRPGEVVGPFRDLLLVGGGLRSGEGKGPCPSIIPVLLEQPLDLILERTLFWCREGIRRPRSARRGQRLAGIHGKRVQVVGREVRTQVGAVSPDGAVVHEAVFQEDLLPGTNLVPREKRLAGRPHDGVRDGGCILVAPDGLPDQDTESENQNHDDRVSPPRREPLGSLHASPLRLTGPGDVTPACLVASTKSHTPRRRNAEARMRLITPRGYPAQSPPRSAQIVGGRPARPRRRRLRTA